MSADLAREVSALREEIAGLRLEVRALIRHTPDPPEWATYPEIPQWFPGRAGLSERSLQRMAANGTIRRRFRGGRAEVNVNDLRAMLANPEPRT